MNKQTRILALTVAVFGACLLGSLSGCGGSSSSASVRSTTVGQELKDLDDARNKGLLTEDEYNKKREEIMKRK